MNTQTFGRVYGNLSISKMLRLKTFFISCRFPLFVRNLNNIYSISCKILGKRLVNNLIHMTYGDIFLAGETTEDLGKCLQELKKEGLIGIADYAREFLTKEEEKLEIEGIIKMYKDSIDIAMKVGESNSIAIKVSSFGDVEMLRKLNSLQFVLTQIEDLLNCKSYEKINSDILVSMLESHKITFKNTFSENSIENFKQNKAHLNIFEIILTNNRNLIDLLKHSLGFKEKEIVDLRDFVLKLNTRLLSVLEHAKSKKCLIMVDAEQSYLRFITDNIVAHYFKQFNKEKCIIAHTLQCYLKTQQNDLRKWHDFCRDNNLYFGLKIVRGAYMNEETKISTENGTASPICESIEETHSNYNKSIEFLFDNYKEGDKFCIATHNLESISLTGEFYKVKGRNENIFCAQLLGIAENATGLCRKYDIKVAKYAPFGNFDILIPYLIRRAEESSMIQKLKSQNDLLNEEFMIRLRSGKIRL